MKKLATDEVVLAFMRAVFPDAPELAMAVYDEAHVLRTATERIVALEAQLAQAKQTICRAHDLVARPNQDASHDFAACLIDGIVSLKEAVHENATDAEKAEQEAASLEAQLQTEVREAFKNGGCTPVTIWAGQDDPRGGWLWRGGIYNSVEEAYAAWQARREER